ncbi:MAG: calcium-translocating P-type ATPase, SERCA-type [Thermoplasmata archaeon]|nr:calcium-translocating P-type ATPase, SERCA-type [Thermoplasmata archaeon]
MATANWHAQSAEKSLFGLGSESTGLSSADAVKRLEKHGPNELTVQKSTSPLTIFLSQFKELMVIILIIATVISAALGEYVDAIVIIIIVILNSILGFFQEYKAEKALLALQQLSAPHAAVLRGGKEISIPARELVPGDIIILRTGDMVPADCRLIDSANLKVNEAALTGESQATKKNFDILCDQNAFIGDMGNMVFSSTTVEYGRGKAVVANTGMHTEIGRIADLIRGQEFEQTPLQVKLDKMGKQIGLAILAICIAVFVVEIIRFGTEEILEIFMVAVSLAVAAIPEGLPAVVTISLALGLQRMIKKNALIRRLPAVETLGSTTVICSDKTGTLTRGVMNIKMIKTLETEYEVDGEGYEPKGNFSTNGNIVKPDSDMVLNRLLMAGTLCNDSKHIQEDGVWTIQGDSTEGAFLVAARKAGLVPEELNKEFPRIGENPFDSDKKFMTVINNDISGQFMVFTKGAADRVIPLCSKKMVGNSTQPLTDDDAARIIKMGEDMASGAYRVLALAYLESEQPITTDDAEKNLIFLGLVGMIDAPRIEAIEAIAKCKKAGIRVVMITGDHKLTAVAIARQMGIADDKSHAYTGVELNDMTDEDLYKIVDKVAVYARVSPEHKMRIVSAWKKRGQIVAMTGDGVNDAPALKKADIGIAMGITGTDVSKEAADMVLTDDNFASIVQAIEIGRGIYDNIRKFVRYMLSTNFGEVLVIFLSSLLGWPLPLIAIQILWINLVTDGLPAVSLGVEPSEAGVMDRKPRNPKDSIFSGGMIYHIVWVGALMTIGTLGIFAYGLGDDHEANLTRARTMAFLTIAFFQLWHVLAIHIEKDTVLSKKFFANPYLLVAVAVSAILQLMVIYVPYLSSIFQTMALPMYEFTLCVLVSSSVFFAVETEKAIRRRKDGLARKAPVKVKA